MAKRKVESLNFIFDTRERDNGCDDPIAANRCVIKTGPTCDLGPSHCYHAFPRRAVSSQIPSLPNGLRQEYRRFLSSILARNQKRQILRQKDFGNGMHTQNHLRRIPDHGFEQRCFVSRLGSAVVIDMRPRTSAPSITQHRVSRQLRISFATQHTLLACGAGGQ